ncbi:MAG: dTDP-4-dehydrorhamnose 3,5-epimerase [Ignavibacteria bacterium]|nr:dTDP-4-dehydrorhamnose 3,5-epimerase [Ignavibacteria bacterium]
MGFTVTEEHLNGIRVIEPSSFKDERGFFMEAYREDYFEALGLPTDFKQENHSGSVQNVLRGLHFQWDKPMGKLLRATQGKILLVEVDIRVDSPTFGRHCMIEVSAENRKMVWIPPGFANGFLIQSTWAEVQYKCTTLYNPKAESSIRWNDPKLDINWGITNPILSTKDSYAQTFDHWLAQPEAQLFRMSI